MIKHNTILKEIRDEGTRIELGHGTVLLSRDLNYPNVLLMNSMNQSMAHGLGDVPREDYPYVQSNQDFKVEPVMLVFTSLEGIDNFLKNVNEVREAMLREIEFTAMLEEENDQV